MDNSKNSINRPFASKNDSTLTLVIPNPSPLINDVGFESSPEKNCSSFLGRSMNPILDIEEERRKTIEDIVRMRNTDGVGRNGA